MATTTIPRTAIKGGSFLIESCRPEEIFSPADLSDDQKLIGQTAEEFVTKEVLPLANELEQHKEGLMPELVRKAAELGLKIGRASCRERVELWGVAGAIEGNKEKA